MAENTTNAGEEHPSPATKPTAKQQDSWFEIIKTIVYALLIAGVIRSFLFQPFNIPSGSMENTLLVGDYLFVSKAAYGYSRYSFPFGLVPFDGRFFSSQPHRGDVVVFKMPNKASPDYMKDYIKRLIGMPGDRIQVKDGVLYLNGQMVPRQKVSEGMEFLDGFEQNVTHYRETLPGGKSYEILASKPYNTLNNTDVFVVPEGDYFMMGDNRDNSADSRADVGYVPFEDLVGKAEIIFFSTDDSARLWEIWKWPFAVRYGRIGKLID